MSVKISLIVKRVCAVLFALVAEDLKWIMCSTSDCDVPEQENLYKKQKTKQKNIHLVRALTIEN